MSKAKKSIEIDYDSNLNDYRKFNEREKNNVTNDLSKLTTQLNFIEFDLTDVLITMQ